MERLENILGEFKEAIVICDPYGWILLFNPQARQLFGKTMALNLRHSLFGLCHPAPFDHAFRLLRQRAAGGDRFGAEGLETKFVCSTIKDDALLNCHLRLIPSDQSEGPVFVMFFSVTPQQIDETGWKASALAGTIEEFRGPLANLNAAAENLKANPDLPLADRIEFERVIAAESANLLRRFESVVLESRALTYCQWPLTDIHAADLVRSVARDLNQEGGITVTMTGVPLWLHADSHSLKLTLGALVRAVHQACGPSLIDIEVMPGQDKVYFDIVWQGEPLPQGLVESWLQIPLPDTVAGITVADVLARHASDLWSQPHRRQGFSRLRIPVPNSRGHWDEESGAPLPARPERPVFMDAEAMDALGPLADRPLATLDYVVFRTVTSGLDPSADNDLLSLAGVKIDRLRILGDDGFRSLVNPQRPIPLSTVSLHGISKEMVKGQPPTKVVLSEFASFVGKSVLVGHNAAIDLNALRGAGKRGGSGFGNAILDTLLLSRVVDSEVRELSLDGLCRQLGVPMNECRTPMGASLLTAQLFLRLLELLAAKGITTLGQAMIATAEVAAERP